MTFPSCAPGHRSHHRRSDHDSRVRLSYGSVHRYRAPRDSHPVPGAARQPVLGRSGLLV